MKKMISSLLCVVMAAALFAGCGKASSDEEKSGDTPSVGDTANDGDNIVRYTLTSTPQIDPGVGSDLGAATVLINLYDPLVQPQKDGSTAPWIATEWETSEDGKTWTFKLRDDVKFHSGNPLTAADVVYSMQRNLDMGEGFGYLFSSVVEEAKEIDDTTVQSVINLPEHSWRRS